MKNTLSRAAMNTLNQPVAMPTHASSFCLSLTGSLELADDLVEASAIADLRTRIKRGRYGKKSRRAQG